MKKGIGSQLDQNKHNATTEAGRRGGSQVAPVPRTSGQQYLGSSKHTAPVQGQLARVKDGGKAPEAGSHLPVQNSAMRGLVGPASPIKSGSLSPGMGGGSVGSGTVPKQSGANLSGIRAGSTKMQPAFKGAAYTDGAKVGSSGKDAGPLATRIPKRRGKGAAFFGEYA